MYYKAYMWNLKKPHSQKPWNCDYQCLGSGRNGKMLVGVYKLPVLRQLSSGDLIYNVITIANNAV